MSVRNGILAILTLGPAYGLQLHGELLHRAAHRESVNVGQIYSTIERLRAQNLVAPAGTTDDGSPLYSLTSDGAAEAADWLDGRSPVEPDWSEMLDRVLLACSLSTADPAAVVDAYARYWAGKAAVPAGVPRSARSAAALAEAELARAAERWLDEVRPAATAGVLQRSLTDERPRRGRRPSVA
jgi:DNA-binding PadR family transcriptional regulator